MQCIGSLEFMCDFQTVCRLTHKNCTTGSINKEINQRECNDEDNKENVEPLNLKNSIDKSKKPLGDKNINNFSPNTNKSSYEANFTKNCVLSNAISILRSNGDVLQSGNQSGCSITKGVDFQLSESKEKTGKNSNVPFSKSLDNLTKIQKINPPSTNSFTKKNTLPKNYLGCKENNRNLTGKQSKQHRVMIFRNQSKKHRNNLVTVNRILKLQNKTNYDDVDNVPLLQRYLQNAYRNNNDDNNINLNQPSAEKARIFSNELKKSHSTPKTHTVKQGAADVIINSNAEMHNNIEKTVTDCSLQITPILEIKEEVDIEEDCEYPSMNTTPKSNNLVWIPTKNMLWESNKLETRGELSASNTSTLPCNDPGLNCAIESESSIQNSKNIKVPPDSKIINSSNQDETTLTMLSQGNEPYNLCTKSETTSEALNLSTAKSLNNHNSDVNRRKGKTFGKIAELISDEEKLTIESHYVVDKTSIDDEKVRERIIKLDKKKFMCNICQAIYERMDKCQVHVWNHLHIKPYRCNACEYSTGTVTNVRCHIRKSHLKIKPFRCIQCSKQYPTAVLLNEHLNTHTGERPFKCNMCDFASPSRQVLLYHSTTHKTVKDVKCTFCNRMFYSRNRMRAHMLTHKKNNVVICYICSSYLSSEKALEAHCKNVHEQDYFCETCGKAFKSKKALHNHRNVHLNAKFKCHLCNNTYKSKHILKEHLWKHEGLRTYKCKICEKSFAQQSHLAAHNAVHSSRRYYCPGCNKPFNRHDNMKIHATNCKVIAANPELRNLIVRRKHSKSENQNHQITISTNSSGLDIAEQNIETRNNGNLAETTKVFIINNEEIHNSSCNSNNGVRSLTELNMEEVWECNVNNETGEIVKIE